MVVVRKFGRLRGAVYHGSDRPVLQTQRSHGMKRGSHGKDEGKNSKTTE